MPATKQARPAAPSPTTAAPKALPPARRRSKGSKAVDVARGLRRVLILHGEKMLFGGCIVACLVFCGIGLTHLPYGKTPDELKAATTKVLNDLESTNGEASQMKKLPKAPKVDKLTALAGKSTPASAYALGPLRTPYQDRQLRRGEPKILPIERLLASSGYGPIAILGAAPAPAPVQAVATEAKPADPAKLEEERRKKLIEEKKKRSRRTPAKAPPAKPAKEEKKTPEPPVAPQEPPKEKALLAQAPSDAHLEYRNWICLVGAIPFVDQAGEYHRAFHEAMFQSPERDQPHYALPQIERAEIAGNKQLRWRRVNVISALEDHANWAADYPEPADERLIDPDLTEPLPPLVSVNFKQQEVSHPRVKVVVVETPQPADDKATAGAAADDSKEKTASPAKKPPAPILGLRDKKPAADKSPPQNAAPEKSAEEEQKDQKPSGPPPIEIVRYRLFRFFDFDVQPGKTYCYRVKLVALNPNYELPVRYLARPAGGEELFLDGAWSTPTSPVKVAEGIRVLAGSVAAAETADGDDETDTPDLIAQVLVHFYDFATSKVTNVIFNAVRGTLLDQPSVPATSPADEAAPSKPPRGSKPRDAQPPPAVDVLTGAVVVDYFGGEKIAAVRGGTVPSHVLVLDRYGKYRALSQADDAAAFEADLPSAHLLPTAEEQARK